MEGRDIGTVVLPTARVKVFLTASLSLRALRRFLELQVSRCYTAFIFSNSLTLSFFSLLSSLSSILIHFGDQNSGKNVTLESVSKEMRERDEKDTHRHVSPLVKAPDAVEVNTGFSRSRSPSYPFLLSLSLFLSIRSIPHWDWDSFHTALLCPTGITRFVSYSLCLFQFIDWEFFFCFLTHIHRRIEYRAGG